MTDWTAADAEHLLAKLRAAPRPVAVSNHAAKRIRKRVGLPNKATLRAARLAFERGTPVLVTSESASVGFRHGRFVWLFAHTFDAPTLVTVMPLGFFGNQEGTLREICPLPRL